MCSGVGFFEKSREYYRPNAILKIMVSGQRKHIDFSHHHLVTSRKVKNGSRKYGGPYDADYLAARPWFVLSLLFFLYVTMSIFFMRSGVYQAN